MTDVCRNQELYAKYQQLAAAEKGVTFVGEFPRGRILNLRTVTDNTGIRQTDR
jgi:UDP-galactopyranose mutase